MRDLQAMKSINYSTQLADLSCLVYQKSTNTYAPYNKVTNYQRLLLMSYEYIMPPPL